LSRRAGGALRSRERAVLRAFTEALLPGGNGLPRGAEVDAVGPVSRLLLDVSPRIRVAIRLVLVLFEVSSFPRRFSKLPLERRASHLARASRSSGLRRDSFLLLKSLATLGYARDEAVQRAVGVSARCERAGSYEPRVPAAPALSRAALRAPDRREDCDVVVVGSGAGGAAAARTLAEAGLSVIVVEEGEYHDASSYSPDPFVALPALYREAGLTVCEGRPPIPLPLGRCVGGTTVINSGTCLRTPTDVLAAWRDQFGISWAPELEGEFEALERDLHVVPVDPERAGRNAELCRAGAEAIGASNGPISRNAGDVVCCGTCPSGCQLDAKQAAHVSELPRAVAAGALVRSNARAERVTVRGGAAVGVRCRGGYEVSARAVVLAAGAIGTPELLLRQRIGTSSGELGRNLMIHPACWVGARFEREVRGWEGVMQSWHVDEWSDRGLFLEATFTPLAFGAHWLPGTGDDLAQRIAGYDRMAIIGVHMSDRSSRGRVRAGRAGTRIAYRLSEEDAAAIRFGIARAADIHFAAGATEVYPQLGDISTVAPGEQERAIEHGRFRPRDMRLEAFHPMGTARMASDPSRSVVAPSGEVHGLARLYVADASIFPTSLKVNPMITIMACARRIARDLADRLT
jgi:choline dehydrogenase-like flavoprotein